MDKVGQELFEEINNNLKNLALFLDKLSNPHSALQFVVYIRVS
jgi:hypothetical protein